MDGVGVLFAYTSLIAGVLYLVLGSYVLAKNPLFSIAEIFFVTMLMAFFVTLFDFLSMTSTDPSSAETMARAQTFFFTLMLGGYLLLSSQIPFENHDSWIWRNLSLYSIVVVVFAVTGALLNGEVIMLLTGWEMTGEIGLGYLFLTSITFAAASVHLLHRTYASSLNEEARLQCVLLAFGIYFPIVYLILLYAIEPVAPGVVDLGGLAYLITMVIFAFGVLRYKMFIITPVVEETLLQDDDVGKGRGNELPSCILIEEKRPEISYELFLNELSNGGQGLVISRSHPDAIRSRYGLERTPIIWLANQPGQDRVEPGNLSILGRLIADFIRRSDRAVVILDGVEFLMASNELAKILQMIYSINDEAVMANAKLIVPLDSQVMNRSDLAFFEREFEILRMG